MHPIEKEMEQYPETGIVNQFINTQFVLTEEMVEFLDGFILAYKDYPDSKIVEEFAVKYGMDYSSAKKIEHAYVVVNRALIYKRIKKLLKAEKERDTIIKQICSDFGLDTTNATKYLVRYHLDCLDEMSGLYIKS